MLFDDIKKGVHGNETHEQLQTTFKRLEIFTIILCKLI